MDAVRPEESHYNLIFCFINLVSVDRLERQLQQHLSTFDQ